MLSMIKKFFRPSLCRKIFVAAVLFFSAGNFNNASAVVKLGDSGEEVKEVQVCLIAQELLSGEADGICGESTVQAIKDFQTAVGLPVDGVCGPETFRLLRAAAYGEIDITDFMVEVNPEPQNTFSVDENIEENYAEVGSVIKKGSKGPGVVDIQKKLSALGFFSGDVDGICGDATVQAIKDFQESIDMTPDGICGIMTYAAMENAPYGGGDEFTWEESFDGFPRYKRVMQVEATAYSPQEPGLGIHTASGTVVRRGVIAVDPFFIPFGTRVYIPGYGEAVAEDTGDAIIGHRIDIAFDTYVEALEFGRRTIEIYILED